MLSMQRTFTKEIYETLLDYFTLTADEKDELNHAFLIEQIGIERFQTHMEIKRLLETSASMLYPADTEHFNIVTTINNTISNGMLLHNSYQIISAIDSILLSLIKTESEPFLYTFVDITQPFMTSFFKSLYNSSFNNLHIHNLIELKKSQAYNNSHNNIQNVRIINSLLPFFTSYTGTYKINYYYSDDSNFKKCATVFPFYFITNTHVILLSADFETALFLSDKSIHEYYIKAFNSALSKSYVLTDGPQTSLTLLNELNTANSSEDCPICINVQPTIELFVTPSMIDKYILDNPYKDIIKAQLLERIERLSQVQHTIIFTLDGLNLFVEQGKHMNFPDYIAMHFDIDDRIYMLNKIIESNNNDSQNDFLLLNPTKMQASLNISIAVNPASTSLQLFINKDGNQVYIPLQENTLYNCFTDFLQNLLKYDFVYSIEETNKILRQEIHKLKNQNMPISSS